MALFSLTALAYAIPLGIVYYILSSWLERRRLDRFAKANGATFPKHVHTKLPFAADYVWNMVRTMHAGGDLLDDIIERNFRNFGTTFSLPGFFGGDEVYTVDPENIKAVLATRFNDYDLGARRIKMFEPLLGKSIFTADGPFWEHSRAIFRPQFSRDNINDLQKTEGAVQAFFRALPLVGNQADGTVTVDLMPMLFRFTLDTATEFLFGESVASQTAAATGKTSTTSAATAIAADVNGSDMTFAEAFHEAQLWIATRARMQGLYWLAPSGKGKHATAYLRKYVDHYVRLALQSAKPSSEKYSLLETLIEHTKDKDELRDQIFGILLAGRDTTATLLSWTLLALAQHPRVFEKLRRAVVEEFGEYSDEMGHIDFGALKSSQYLQYVLRESLRIYNPVPINNRNANKETVLPRGGGPDGTEPVVIRKGQIVNFVPYALSRRADIWGEDSFEFRPERWEGVRLDWNYVPFSGGPRICLGQQFALTEAGYFLVRLLQKFDTMDWVGPSGKPRKDIHLSMCPKDGVPVKLRFADA